ncbi:sulfotransferase family 2 domain-containing protein [Ruegeria marisrubri]|nr:sulfotransferase family 2 domain-containing protein [Ruegeria marisrubri]
MRDISGLSLREISAQSDPRQVEGFSFSVVRHPINRFRSFYLDKFCRGSGHHNHRDWLAVYQALLCEVTPASVLQFVSSVPTGFEDPHWRSMRSNLFYGDRPLVDRIYTTSEIEQLATEISGYLGQKVAIPRALATERIEAPQIREQLAALAPKIMETYAEDVVLVEGLAKSF